MKEETFPKTLLGAIKYFADRDNSLNFMVQIHWPEGVTCPWCDSSEHSFISTRRVWKCKSCRKQFSAKAGTIFEDSPIGLDKWFPAVWMIVNMKNGISSYELGKHLGVTQKTAWFMNHRIRKAMQTGTFIKFVGEVEVDETFIGGKARNMHIAQRKRRMTGTGTKDKVAVMGILQRGGEVRTVVVDDRKKKTLQAEVKEHVEAGAALYGR